MSSFLYEPCGEQFQSLRVCDACFNFQSANGHEECVDALLHNGAEVSVRDVRGRTPLHFAAMCGHVGLLGSLLQVRKNLNKGVL